jgi:putative transposase
MDGKGRATDKAFIDRLWRSVKYENVYLNLPNDGIERYEDLKDYYYFYNEECRYQSLDDEIPG